MADDLLNDRLSGPPGGTCLSNYIVSVSDIVRKMLVSCGTCKVLSDTFTVNKLLTWWVTCFVQRLCIIVFNESLDTQACQTNQPHVCFCLQSSVFVLSRSPQNIHHLYSMSSAQAQFAAKHLTRQSMVEDCQPRPARPSGSRGGIIMEY